MTTHPTTPTDTTSFTIQIVTQVADTLDTTPLELDPLYETIDPHSLEQFIAADNAIETGLFTFTYEGCTISVTKTGNINVEAPHPNSG